MTNILSTYNHSERKRVMEALSAPSEQEQVATDCITSEMANVEQQLYIEDHADQLHGGDLNDDRNTNSSGSYNGTVTCEHCCEEMLQKQIFHHYLICEDFPTTCYLDCGRTDIKRSCMKQHLKFECTNRKKNFSSPDVNLNHLGVAQGINGIEEDSEATESEEDKRK